MNQLRLGKAENSWLMWVWGSSATNFARCVHFFVDMTIIRGLLLLNKTQNVQLAPVEGLSELGSLSVFMQVYRDE
jgi:hypothetical protein